MSRRFVTKADVAAAAESGERVLRVGRRDTVTDVAREHAQQRGIRIERTDEDSVRAPASGGPVESGSATAAPEITRRRVRRAVIAALGTAPDDLDAVIDKVLRD